MGSDSRSIAFEQPRPVSAAKHSRSKPEAASIEVKPSCRLDGRYISQDIHPRRFGFKHHPQDSRLWRLGDGALPSAVDAHLPSVSTTVSRGPFGLFHRGANRRRSRYLPFQCLAPEPGLARFFETVPGVVSPVDQCMTCAGASPDVPRGRVMRMVVR